MSVRDLTFAYGSGATPVVDGLDLDLPGGTHLAVVGPSGVGKSTFANLLAGLLAPERGTIWLGGVETRHLAEADLRRLVGLVPQEAYVFAGSLRENLTYLAPKVSDVELAHATTLIGMAPVVERLGGWEALIGAGGAELSDGERQLIALVRMYLSPARVVILDEAMSNLDPVAEARAEQAFASRSGTLVVVAHRLSSAHRAERILLFDGKAVCLGTHAELLRASPIYADLVGHWEMIPCSADSVSAIPARPCAN
jgi:ATP-binding cassette subfamily C protein